MTTNKRTAYNHMYLYEHDGKEVWGTWDDYFAMKGYPDDSDEPAKINKKKPLRINKKKSFWKFW